MTILSDEAILSALDVGEIEIDPFHSDNLTPNGYDSVSYTHLTLPTKA